MAVDLCDTVIYVDDTDASAALELYSRVRCPPFPYIPPLA